jgi:ComF family protein
MYAATEEGCPRCRDDRFAFDRAFRLGPYAGVLRDVILQMKEGSGEALAETVGHLWAAARTEQFRATGCTLVVPVPLHWRKRFTRGYNPAAALARSVAKELGFGYRNLLRRTRYTRRQTDQTPENRRTNVKGAFAVARGQKAQDVRVLLVDDVLTSGSTCSAAAAALVATGAAQVSVAVLAHR